MNRIGSSNKQLAVAPPTSFCSWEKKVHRTLLPTAHTETPCSPHHPQGAFPLRLHTAVPYPHSASLPQRTLWTLQGSDHRKYRRPPCRDSR